MFWHLYTNIVVTFTPLLLLGYVTQSGPPIGILAAQKATEMAKARGMGEMGDDKNVSIPQVKDKGDYEITGEFGAYKGK